MKVSVYKIIHNQSNICYVGSTTLSLAKRFSLHTSQNDTTIGRYIEQYGPENFTMILIKEYDVVDAKCAIGYEQLWINKLKPINKMNPSNLLNRDTRMRKFKITCECGKRIIKESIASHARSKYHKNWIEKNMNSYQRYQLSKSERP